jgi:hypothetical protein
MLNLYSNQEIMRTEPGANLSSTRNANKIGQRLNETRVVSPLQLLP